MGSQESDMIEQLSTAQYIFVVVQLLSCVGLFATLWTAAHQVPLSFTISRSLLKLMSIESVIPSNHLILCRPRLLLPLIFEHWGLFPVSAAARGIFDVAYGLSS